MIKILLPFTLLLVISCGEQNNNSKREKNRRKTEQNDSVSNDTDTIVKTESKEPQHTDWEKFQLKGKVKSLGIHTFQIDENGEQIGMGGSYQGYDFSEDGRFLEESSAGCCGAEFVKAFYVYNDQKQLTHKKFHEYEPDEKQTLLGLVKKEKYFHNSEGELVKMKMAYADSVLQEEHEYKFNEEGQLIREKVTFQNDDPNYTILFEYSEDKDVERYVYEDESKNYKRIYYKDTSGLITSEELYTSKGSIQQTQYIHKFDKQGNWIEAVHNYRYILEDGTKEEWRKGYKTERTIEYFD